MSANHAPSAARAETGGRLRWILGLLAIASFASGAAEPTQESQEMVAAVLKARELNFHYRSFTGRFPCYELENRVKTILRAVGARDDLQVSAMGCNMSVMPESDFPDRSDPWDPTRDHGDLMRNPGDPMRDQTDRLSGRRSGREQSAQIRIRLMTPVAVTPEVLAEVEKDKSRRELVSRVTGNPAMAMNDPIVFAARRQPVTLSRQSIRLEPEDCDLLDQLSRSVFRQLDIRVVRGGPSCDRYQLSRIPPQATVEALLPTGAIVPMPRPESNRNPQSSPSSAAESPAANTPPPSAPASEAAPPQSPSDAAPE